MSTDEWPDGQMGAKEIEVEGQRMTVVPVARLAEADESWELWSKACHEARAERDLYKQQRDELLAWVEEQAEGAEHVAEKLKREGDDFDDRAYYEDAERFTAQANVYRAVAQQIERVRKGGDHG